MYVYMYIYIIYIYYIPLLGGYYDYNGSINLLMRAYK